MLRVAGSLKLGTVNSTQLIHTLQRDGKPSMLGRALVVWNTRYMEVAIDSLRKTGHDIPNADIQRLSPLDYMCK
ncbi:Tn3 family transposase [Clostridium sp. FP1]|uniref:Tn3 family transposase n=1 Tax=Clostridium sp. FP1 TaxID=2724076 RepID=UPI0013E9499D|nr:Tn3 family transposase [Clostridium sp. FP1]MBZ9637428.1 transposase [Clostridium sp. FP1]